MSDRVPQSCNRQPFLSDQECDRGSVDIHQFDDFPFCESIDPTQAEIPPEIVDTPINLPVPPACACFNIDYDLKLKYNKERKFAASAEFSANGDCCEGNYVSNLNLEIPCPVIGSGTSRRIKMKIGYGSGNGSADVSYLLANQDSCTIEAQNVDIDLDIPCPIQNPVDRKVKIGISYGQAFRGASAKVVEANAEKCELEILEPTFTLNIPCPVKKGVDKKIKIGISYGKHFNTVSGSVIKTGDSCTIEANPVTFALQIPCPILGRDGKNPKIRAKIDWGSKQRNVSASFINANTKECTIEPKDVNLNLEIPCPVQKREQPAKVKLGVKWGSKSYVSASLLKTDPLNCTIEPKDVNLNLEIPCPVRKREQPAKLKLGVKWGSKSYVSASILKTDPLNCTIEANGATFDLEIPCPIVHHPRWHRVRYVDGKRLCYVVWRRRWVWANKQGDFTSYSTSFLEIDESNCTIRAGNLDLDIPCPVRHRDQPAKVRLGVKWGSKSYVSASLLKTDSKDCMIETNDATFNLEIPCPVKKDGDKKIKIGIAYGDQFKSASASVIKTTGSCTIEANPATFDLQIPCPLSRHQKWHHVKNIDGKKWCFVTWRRRWSGINSFGNYASFSTSFLKINESSCIIEAGKLDLDIPCPVHKTRLNIETSASMIDGSVGEFKITTDSFDINECKRKLKLKVRFPRTTRGFDLSVLNGLIFVNNVFWDDKYYRIVIERKQFSFNKNKLEIIDYVTDDITTTPLTSII